MKLAERFPWEMFEDHFGEQYCPDNGRPGLPIRMMVGLLLPKHTRGLSDEEVVEWWLDSPNAQCFCGETHFQQELHWFEASSKLCASGSEATFQGESRCACASSEADEGGGEEIVLLADLNPS